MVPSSIRSKVLVPALSVACALAALPDAFGAATATSFPRHRGTAALRAGGSSASAGFGSQLDLIRRKAKPGFEALRNKTGWFSGTANGHPVRLTIYTNAVQGRADGHDVRLQLYTNAVHGEAKGGEVRLQFYSNAVHGKANGHDVRLQLYSNAVHGEANGHEVRIQFYSNAVRGKANGHDLRLDVYSNGVFGKANGHDVRINAYANGASGTANGHRLQISGGREHLWRVLDALVLKLPVPVLDRVAGDR